MITAIVLGTALIIVITLMILIKDRIAGHRIVQTGNNFFIQVGFNTIIDKTIIWKYLSQYRDAEGGIMFLDTFSDKVRMFSTKGLATTYLESIYPEDYKKELNPDQTIVFEKILNAAPTQLSIADEIINDPKETEETRELFQRIKVLEERR